MNGVNLIPSDRRLPALRRRRLCAAGRLSVLTTLLLLTLRAAFFVHAPFTRGLGL